MPRMAAAHAELAWESSEAADSVRGGSCCQAATALQSAAVRRQTADKLLALLPTTQEYATKRPGSSIDDTKGRWRLRRRRSIRRIPTCYMKEYPTRALGGNTTTGWHEDNRGAQAGAHRHSCVPGKSTMRFSRHCLLSATHLYAQITICDGIRGDSSRTAQAQLTHQIAAMLFHCLVVYCPAR